MSSFTYGGRTYTKEVFDVIYDFGQETNTAWDFWVCLGEGESGLNEHADHDQNLGGGVFGSKGPEGMPRIYTPVHGGTPGDWKGVEGTRKSMHEMWYTDGRWQRMWALFGGWEAWSGVKPVPDEWQLAPVWHQGQLQPVDPMADRLGRIAFLYHGWPRFQGSVRPTWKRTIEVVSRATLLSMIYLELRSGHEVPDLAYARSIIDDYTATVEALEDSVFRSRDQLARVEQHRNSAREALAKHIAHLA